MNDRPRWDDGKLRHNDVMRSRQLAGRVQRYHTWPTIRQQSTGEHACRVLKLYVELWGMPRAEVLYHCATHDDGELASGDVPFYAKRAVPELAAATNQAELMGRTTLGLLRPELTESERRKFKMCDLLEMWEFSVVERNMGNRYADVVISNLIPAIGMLASELVETEKVNKWMAENRRG